MTVGSRMILFAGLSTSRRSTSSDSGFGSGFGGGGVYLGEAAASAAATSGETARERLGVDGGGAFSAGLGARMGEAAGAVADWPEAIGSCIATPNARAAI